MANTLRFKRGLVSGIPTAALGEPLFTTDTFDLYIGNGTGNTRFQKYIASGTTSQILRGDGSLYTFPLAISSPTTGQVLKYNGTSWVNDSDAGITGSGAAGQVAYFTGATTQSGSNNLFWNNANNRLGIGTNTPTTILTLSQTGAGTVGPNLRIHNTSPRQIGNTARISFAPNADYTTTVSAAYIDVIDTDGIVSNPAAMVFGIGSGGVPTEAMRINSAKRVLIGSSTDNGLRFQVTGDGSFSGGIGIGGTPGAANLRLSKTIVGTGSTFGYGVLQEGVIQSNVTSFSMGFYNLLQTQATSFTLNSYYHYHAQQGTFGAGSTITNQFGYFVDASLTGATNNYGFYGNIASGTGRWNLYMNGTANNYMAGSLGIGATPLVNSVFRLGKSITGGAIAYGIYNGGSIQNDVTSFALIYYSRPDIAAGTSVSNLFHYSLDQGTYSGTVTNQYGFSAGSAMVGATNNYGFYGNIAAATGRWNFYANGSAANYFNGNTIIGTLAADSGDKLQVNGTMKVTGASTFGGNIEILRSIGLNDGLKLTNTGGGYLQFINSSASLFQPIIQAQANGNASSLILKGLQTTTASPTATVMRFIARASDDSSAVSGVNAMTFENGTTTVLTIASNNAATFSSSVTATSFNGTTNNIFSTGGTERMRLDASGNLGLGVTPSAWHSNISAAQLGFSASISQRKSGFGFYIGHNYYFPSDPAVSGINSAIALYNNGAALYQQDIANHKWYVAASTTAGSAITFTQAMTLDASGRLGIGTTSPTSMLDVVQSGATAGISVSGGINPQLRATDGTIAAKVQAITGLAAYIGTETNHQLRLIVNNSPLVYLFTTTNVSVGSSSDTGEKLQVNGTMRVSGNATMTNAVLTGGGTSLVTGTGLFSKSVIQVFDGGSASTNVDKIADLVLVNNTSFTDGIVGRVIGVNTNPALTEKRIAQILFQIDGDTRAGQIILGTTNNASVFNNHLTIRSTGAATFSSSIQAGTAIAIGTTPDTNKPFKILKNINGTVGINFENTSTGSSAFSAIQMGTDVTGGTKFANLVYASSGVSASGVYQPDGTSLINNGSGGLNFLGTPIRFFTSTGNGTLRWLFDNEGAIQFTTTAPTTSATDGYKQYSADVTAGNAAPHFRTENGAIIKLYQETTAVGNSTISVGGGNAVLDDTEFDGYTLRQIVRALRNQGILQ